MASPLPAVNPKLLPKDIVPLRYLEAVAPGFPIPVAGEAQSSIGSSEPRYSDDVTLNALAQHGALRLNCRRAIISIVSRSAQYVIAEATRTISLRSGHVHAPGDELWLGCAVLPASSGLCQWTVAQLNAYGSETASAESGGDNGYFVVKNLAEDSRFKDAPFVVGAPFLRFYAGVPIFSEAAGQPIGSYCVVDDKPGEDLDDVATKFMVDMAHAVARHLELLRSRLERTRSEKMVRGIGSFVEGKTSIREWWSLKRSQLARPDFDPSQEGEGHMNPEENESEAAGGARTGSTTIERPSSQLDTAHSQSGSENLPNPEKNAAAAPQSTPKDLISNDIKKLFSRASNIIREAAEVEGVLFLDASSAGLQSNTHKFKKGHNASPQSTSADDLSLTENDDAPQMCNILGFSTSQSSSINSAEATIKHRSVDERLLKALLRSFPTGKIFNLDELSSSDSETASGLSDGREDDTLTASSTVHPEGNEARKKRKLRAAVFKRHEAANMAKIFPGAKSIAFFPLWDAQKERWYAGSIAYTKQTTRALTVEGELSYLAAFGNSIMAEVSRLVALRADRAKADFISSISHELRSPLHGILGNAEFLKSTTIDTLQSDMIHSIETCGHTLLDTVNHLLDFAKINNFLRSSKRTQSYRRGSSFDGASRISSPTAGMMMLESDLDLAILTEEVLQTAFSSHDFHSNSYANDTDFISSPKPAETALMRDQPTSKKLVTVILDIQPANSYVFHSQSGALRRILMNACGNAFKYTDNGFVRVKLQRSSLNPSAGGDTSEVTITISDSGKGISKGYIRDRLYTPFAQEDPHSAGTGLGLSIMKQITSSLHGSIDVQSEEDSGTSVQIVLRLKHAEVKRDKVRGRELELLEDHEHVLRVAEQTKGWKIALYGFLAPKVRSTPQQASKISALDSKAIRLMEESIRKLSQSWFKMHVIGTNTGDGPPDIYVTNPAGAEELRSSLDGSDPVHVVAIYPDSRSAAGAAETMSSRFGNPNFHCVAQPLGPVKFATVMSSVLRQKKSTTVKQPPTTVPQINHPVQVKSIASQHETPLNNTTTPAPIRTPRQSTLGQSTPVKQESIKGAAPTTRLLIVEDNNINLQLLVSFCKKQNVNYTTATNGLEALEAYKATQGKFDCILMDISMPVMDGMQATRAIRQYERDTGLKQTSIVALTGLASEAAQQEASNSGINLFLTKPVKLQELQDLLQTRRGKITGVAD